MRSTVLESKADLLRSLSQHDAGNALPPHARTPYQAGDAESPLGHWGSAVKRATDIVLALAMMVLTAPVLILLAVAIYLDSPGPVIFRQRRHGLNNSEFQIFKFRTMRVGSAAGHGDGAVQTQREDSRITRVGRFLRTSSLDELPQLLNVLNGTMSIVGPRPHPVVMRTQGRLCEEIVPEYALRHRVKPGITGWAQVNGFRGATETIDQLAQRVKLDIHYVENWSFLFDLKIILQTPYSVLCQRENAF